MRWSIKQKAPVNFLKQFPEYSSLIAQLLYNRGLKNQEQVDEFFNPDYSRDIHDPFLIKEMKKGVRRIIKAIKKQEKIIVYGDYDADGICASVILIETMKDLGAKNLAVYIPDREKENHGLNEKAIRKFSQDKVDLVITVDCASRDLEEAALAKSLGLDIIITDHHRTGEKLPKTRAFINPWQKNDRYPFKELSGAGLAYKLAQALRSELKINQGAEKWLLDLVALATAADVSPVIGENRTLIKYGLGVLAQTKRIGLQALMETAKLNPVMIKHSVNGEAPLTNLNTYTLGYILGPRLNAASRMDHADTAFHLLMAKNKKEAMSLAKKLNESNKQRQILIEKIVSEVKRRIKNQNKSLKLIFEGDADWPVGIIGLVASKIAEKYRRPTVIFKEKENFSKASSRGIPQFNLIEAIEKCAFLLENFGGHKGAAGFVVANDKREKLKSKLTQIVEERLKNKDLAPEITVEAEMDFEDISWRNYDQIQRFSPFGPANPEPKFLIRGLGVSDLKIVGNGGQHLKMTVNNRFKAIGFNFSSWFLKLRLGSKIDLVFEFIVNEWDGLRDLEMKIVDLKLANAH